MTMKEVRCSLDTEPTGCNERNCVFGHEKPRFIDGEFFPPNLGELASSVCSIEEFVEELIHNIRQEMLEVQTLATHPCTRQEALVAKLTPAESSSPSSTPLVPDTTASTQKAPVGNQNQKWMVPSTDLSTRTVPAAAAAAVTSAMTLASNVSLKISLKEERVSKKRKRVNDNHKLLGPPSKRARPDNPEEALELAAQFEALSIS